MRLLAATILALALAACGGGDGGRDKTSLVAAGDISSCFWRGDEATARLLDDIGGIVAPLGDNAYPDGTYREYRQCYHRTWGRHLDRTRPAVGNHEYRTKDAAGYFGYFGERAGPRGKGWYSYDHEGWHVVVLNSDEPLERGTEQFLIAIPIGTVRSRLHRARMEVKSLLDPDEVGLDGLVLLFPLLLIAGGAAVLTLPESVADDGDLHDR